MEAAAKSNLKSVSLELGGKSPIIIFDDADVDMAVALARRAIFYNKALPSFSLARAHTRAHNRCSSTISFR